MAATQRGAPPHLPGGGTLEQQFKEMKVQAEEKYGEPRYSATSAGVKPKVTAKYKEDPTRTMMAAAWFGTEDMRLVRVPAPDITDPADAIIRNTSCTICGSDLHMFFNKVPSKAGAPLTAGSILGHEAMGIVDKVGPDVKNLKVGDRVVISAPISCGQCDYCKRGQMSLCETTNPSESTELMYGHRMGGLFGYTELTGGFAGSQAEFTRVPFADVNTLKVPDDLRDEQLLLLSDVIPTGWHGNELSKVSEGGKVAVWGAGPVGSMASYLAKNIRKASHVVTIDHNEFRLRRAQANGCDPLNFDDTDVVKELKKRMPPGPEHLIDCVGFRFPKTLLSWLELKIGMQTDTCDIVRELIITARKGAHLALIGDYFDVTNGFPIGAFMEKSLSMTGGQLYCQHYWKHLLQLIIDGKLDPTWEFTHRFTLDQIPQAYDLFAHRKDNVLKVIVYTPFGLDWERQHANRFRPAGSTAQHAQPTHTAQQAPAGAAAQQAQGGRRDVPVV